MLLLPQSRWVDNHTARMASSQLIDDPQFNLSSDSLNFNLGADVLPIDVHPSLPRSSSSSPPLRLSSHPPNPHHPHLDLHEGKLLHIELPTSSTPLEPTSASASSNRENVPLKKKMKNTNKNISTNNILNSKATLSSKRAVLLVAIVERCPSSIPPSRRRRHHHSHLSCTCNNTQSNSPPTISSSSSSTSTSSSSSSSIQQLNPAGHPLRFLHFITPNDSSHSSHNPACEALLKVPCLVFPPDIPYPPSGHNPQTPPQTSSDDRQQHHQQREQRHGLRMMRRSEPSTPTVSNSTHQPSISDSKKTTVKLPSSPVSESPPHSPTPRQRQNQNQNQTVSSNNNNNSNNSAVSQGVTVGIENARTLPISSRAAYDALTESSNNTTLTKHSAIRFSRNSQQNNITTKAKRSTTDVDATLNGKTEIETTGETEIEISGETTTVEDGLNPMHQNQKDISTPTSPAKGRLHRQVAIALLSVSGSTSGNAKVTDAVNSQVGDGPLEGMTADVGNNVERDIQKGDVVTPNVTWSSHHNSIPISNISTVPPINLDLLSDNNNSNNNRNNHDNTHHHKKRSSIVKASILHKRRAAFRYILLNSKTHVFALTARDGSRQYAYCRPISSKHAIVIMSNRIHTPVYISAIEKTAAHYSFIVDHAFGICCHRPETTNTTANATTRVLRRRQKVQQQEKEMEKEKETEKEKEKIRWTDRERKQSYGGQGGVDVDVDEVLKCPTIIAKELCQAALNSIGGNEISDEGDGDGERLFSMVTVSDSRNTSICCGNDTATNKTSTSITAGDILLSGLKENGNWTRRDDDDNRIRINKKRKGKKVQPTVHENGLGVDAMGEDDGDDEGDTTTTAEICRNDELAVSGSTNEKDNGWLFGPWRDREHGNNVNTNESTETLNNSNNNNNASPPWVIALEQEQQEEKQQLEQQQLDSISINNNISSSSLSIERVIELADTTVLLRYFPVRSILSILVALFEERRVCIVGPDTSLTSRIVTSFSNLIHPFEWPHPLSPILVDDMLLVLGAPLPFFVGVLENDVPRAKSSFHLDLEDVLMAHVGSGKMTWCGGDVGELYRRIPRKIRSRIERRLTRAKTSCNRLIYRSKSMQCVGEISNTATAFAGSCDEFSNEVEKVGNNWSGFLFRSWHSQQDLTSTHNEDIGVGLNTDNGIVDRVVSDDGDVVQNIWLDYPTIVGLDKAMRKFYSELFEDIVPPPPNTIPIHLHNPALQQLPKRNVTADPTDGPQPIVTMELSSNDHEKQHSIKDNHHNQHHQFDKKELEKKQLLKAFTETQMFMQWESNKECDFTFGLTQAEPRKKTTLRDTYWRNNDDNNSNPAFTDDAVENNTGNGGKRYHKWRSAVMSDTEDGVGGGKRLHKWRTAVMSDTEDGGGGEVFSGGEGDGGVFSANEDTPRFRRRFRGGERPRRDKVNKFNFSTGTNNTGTNNTNQPQPQQRGKLQFREEVEVFSDVPRHPEKVLSDGEENVRGWTSKGKNENEIMDRLKMRLSSSTDIENGNNPDDDEVESGGFKRPWYTLTGWIAGRDLNIFSNNNNSSNGASTCNPGNVNIEGGASNNSVECLLRKKRMSDEGFVVNSSSGFDESGGNGEDNGEDDGVMMMDEGPKTLSVDGNGRVGRTLPWSLRRKKSVMKT